MGDGDPAVDTEPSTAYRAAPVLEQAAPCSWLGAMQLHAGCR